MKKRNGICLGLLLFVLSSCATGSRDAQIDSELGLGGESAQASYQSAVNELKDRRYDEEQRKLQRLVTDPNFSG